VQVQFQTIIDMKGTAKAQQVKREADAEQATSAIVDAAAINAIEKRSRPSSSMPVVGPIQAACMRQNQTIDGDAKCTMAIADMVHTCNLPDGFGQNPQINAELHRMISFARQAPRI
jgi:hypothetical protein